MTTKEFKGEWEACKDNGLEDLFLKECESICHDKEKFLSFKRNLTFLDRDWETLPTHL